MYILRNWARDCKMNKIKQNPQSINQKKPPKQTNSPQKTLTNQIIKAQIKSKTSKQTNKNPQQKAAKTPTKITKTSTKKTRKVKIYWTKTKQEKATPKQQQSPEIAFSLFFSTSPFHITFFFCVLQNYRHALKNSMTGDGGDRRHCRNHDFSRLLNTCINNFKAWKICN